MVSNYEFVTLKFGLLNGGESDRKLPRMFIDKNLQMTHKKASCIDLTKKNLMQYIKNRCMRDCETHNHFTLALHKK